MIKTNEPICTTENCESDLYIMDIDASERREQLLQLRLRVFQAEEERLSGAQTISVADARRKLRERVHEG